jgi:hypothetical protein
MYFDLRQFEISCLKFKFSKGKITPGTRFMENLQNEISKIDGVLEINMVFALVPVITSATFQWHANLKGGLFYILHGAICFFFDVSSCSSWLRGESECLSAILPP